MFSLQLLYTLTNFISRISLASINFPNRHNFTSEATISLFHFSSCISHPSNHFFPHSSHYLPITISLESQTNTKYLRVLHCQKNDYMTLSNIRLRKMLFKICLTIAVPGLIFGIWETVSLASVHILGILLPLDVVNMHA